VAGKARWRRHDQDDDMTAGAVRGALLVVAVVLGAIVISNAFPGGAAPPAARPTHSPSGAAPSPSPSPPKQHLVCPPPTGIRIAVENAAGVAGLAAATVTRVKPAGYTINLSTDVGNATSTANTTTIYYRTASDKVAALCMKNRFFKIATVTQMPAGGVSASPTIPSAVRLAVFLGSDYADKHPVG
jgi:LytR cell envelope-related transcriptional attenuator